MGVEMVIRFVHLPLGFRHQDRVLVFGPPQNTAEQAGRVRIKAELHVLSLENAKLLQLAVFGPRPNGYLMSSQDCNC